MNQITQNQKTHKPFFKFSSIRNFFNECNSNVGLPFLMGLIAYSFLHVNYNIFYGDDAWSISNVWNINHLGISEDLVFIDEGASGYDQYFGFTFSFVMGNLLHLLGWTKSNVFLVNSIFIWMTAFVWWRILKELPFSASIANLMFVFIPLFPPFFFAGHIGRPDAFVILIIASQLLCFIQKRYFLAAFLTGFAVETHVMGIVGLFFMLAYTIYQYKELILNTVHFKSLFWRFGGGGLTALGFYFLLHADHFSLAELTGIIQSKKDMSSPINNYILAYFTDFDWMAHVWELVLMISVSILYFKNGLHKKNRFLFILMLVLILSTILTRRENRNYLVYIFPAFMMMYFYTFEQLNRLKSFSLILTAMLGVYFSVFYYHNRAYDFEKIIMDIEAVIEKDKLPVMGMADFWFASKEQEFIPIHYYRDFNKLNLEEFYFIQSDYIGHRVVNYDFVKDFYFENYDNELVTKILIMEGKEVGIWKCVKKGNELPQISKVEIPPWDVVVKDYLNKTLLGRDKINVNNVNEL